MVVRSKHTSAVGGDSFVFMRSILFEYCGVSSRKKCADGAGGGVSMNVVLKVWSRRTIDNR